MACYINGVYCADYSSITVTLSSANETSFTYMADNTILTALRFTDGSKLGVSSGNLKTILTISGANIPTTIYSSTGLGGKTLVGSIQETEVFRVTFMPPPSVKINTFTSAQQNDGAVKFTCKATGTYGDGGEIEYAIIANDSYIYSFYGSSGSTITGYLPIGEYFEYGTAYTFTLYAVYSEIYATKTAKQTFYPPSVSTPTNLTLSPAIGPSTTLSWDASTLSYTDSSSGIWYMIAISDEEIFDATQETQYEIPTSIAREFGNTPVTFAVGAYCEDLTNTDLGDGIWSDDVSNTVTYRYSTISRCEAPKIFEISDTLSYDPVELRWSGETPGAANAITGYQIQYQDSSDGNTWPTTWTDLETNWSASPIEVSPPDEIGWYRRFQIRVKGAAGYNYYSDWLISSNILRKDMAPFEGFTDSDIVAQSTKIKAIHMAEMQNRINDLLLFNGQETFSFSEIIAGKTRLTGWTNHILELRNAMDHLNPFHDSWIDITENRPRADVVTQLRNFILGNPYQNAKRYGYRREKANSDPSARITYLYDAEGMTPISVNLSTGEPDYGSWKPFVDEICRPVMLKYDGTVDYELDHDDQTKKIDGTASDISNTSYGGNAMVEFRKYIWVHRSETEQYEEVVFSNVQYDDTYTAYAFTNSSGKVNDAFYWGMFVGTKSNASLRSLVTSPPVSSQTTSGEIALAEANGNGWYIIYKSGWDYICDLLTLLSKTDNAQAAFGSGRTKSSNTSAVNPGSLVSKPAFYGSSNETSDVKTLYIEGLWGNMRERMAGLIMNASSGMLVKMTPPYNTTGDGYTAAPTITGSTDSYIVGSHCSDSLGNLPIKLGGSDSTYMCDKVWYSTSSVNYAFIGGSWRFSTGCGPRSVNLLETHSVTASNSGTRLSYVRP